MDIDDEYPHAKAHEYDIAQICLRAHVTNAEYMDKPKHNQKFCSTCGSPTITTCQSCNAPIRGHSYSRDPIYAPDWKPPLYYHECGSPYPWTDELLRAAQELADEVPNLTDDEKKQMGQDITDIVHNAPRTPAAANRLKRLAIKAGESTKDAIIQLASNIASDALVKLTRGW